MTHAGFPENKKIKVQYLMTVELVLIIVRCAVKLPDPWVIVMEPTRQLLLASGDMDITVDVGDAIGEAAGVRPGVGVAVDIAADDRVLGPADK